MVRKIAVTTDDGQVAQHFGRCPSYTIAEVEGDQVVSQEVIPNPGHQPGYLPRYLSERGVQVVIAGGMGPKAITMFNNFHIEVATGVCGRVENVLTAYLDGKVQGTAPCKHDHDDSCGGH